MRTLTAENMNMAGFLLGDPDGSLKQDIHNALEDGRPVFIRRVMVIGEATSLEASRPKGLTGSTPVPSA